MKLSNYTKDKNNDEVNIELEIKLKLDPRNNPNINLKFEKVYKILISLIEEMKNKKNNKLELTETIDFIVNNSKNAKKKMIKQLNFVNLIQEKTKNKIYEKTSLMKPYFSKYKNVIAYKITLSEEKKINKKEFDNNKLKLIRYKSRLSIFNIFNIKEENNIDKYWKLDITGVNSYDITNDRSILDINKMKKIKETLFMKNTNLDNYLANLKKYDNIEIELEYTDFSRLGINTKKIGEYAIDIANKFLKENSFIIFKGGNNRTNLNKKYNSYLNKIKKILKPYYKKYNFKSLLNKAVDFNKIKYKNSFVRNINDFYLTDKIDGLRAILFIEKNVKYVTILTNDEIKTVDYNFTTKNDYILDGELHNNNFYPFDIIVYKGKEINNLKFKDRINKIMENKESFGFPIKFKEFIKLDKNKYEEQLKKFYNKKKKYKTDGLIFINMNNNYEETKNYKWKPQEKKTIDFVVRKCPKKLLGISPYIKKNDKTLYLLFNGINKQHYEKLNINLLPFYKELFYKYVNKNYFPLQFSPSLFPHVHIFHDKRDDLDNKICEMLYTKDGWILKRIREERQKSYINGDDFGNYFLIAEKIWLDTFNSLKFDDLIKLTKDDNIDENYFLINNNNKYKTTRGFNSFVKTKLLKIPNEKNWIIDLAGGKGQDIFRINNLRYQKYVNLEIDIEALTEMIERKHMIITNKGLKKKMELFPMTIYGLNIDLKKNYNTIQQEIKRKGIPLNTEGANVIIINFAIHYFADKKENLLNLLNLVNSLLKKNGLFIFTCFDGKSIFNLLKTKSNWDVYENAENNKKFLKYSIKKEYVEKKLNSFGQKIKVILPFSNEKYYSEYLVNFNALNSLLKSLKFIKLNYESFDVYFNDFENQNKKIYKMLDINDKKYLSLYYFGIYRKK